MTCSQTSTQKLDYSFTDDTVIYNVAENNTELQDDLRKLEIWESAWTINLILQNVNT